MAAALAGALPKAKAATPGAKTAAAQAGKGQAATVRPKKRSGAARRRSAQAALEASSRPVEASRGPLCPLTPTGVRTRDPRSKTHASNQLVYSAVEFPPLSPGGQYRLGSSCSAGSPAGSPSPQLSRSRCSLQPPSSPDTQSPRTQERPRACSRREQGPPGARLGPTSSSY